MRRSNGGHTFDFAVKPFQHSAAMVASGPQVSVDAQPSVQPGTTYHRAETTQDAAAHFWRGMVISAAGCFAGGAAWLIWPDVPFRVVPICGLAFGAGGILLSVFRPQDLIVAKIEEWTGHDINGDGQVGKVHYALDGTLRDKHGNETYLSVELEGDDAGQCWHNFCRAVLYSKRNFSQNEAARHGIIPKDWKAIYQAFSAQHWVIPAKRRGTPRLKGRGWEWVKLYADTPPPAPGEALSFDDVDR